MRPLLSQIDAEYIMSCECVLQLVCCPLAALIVVLRGELDLCIHFSVAIIAMRSQSRTARRGNEQVSLFLTLSDTHH